MVKQLEAKCKNAKVYFRILPMIKMCWEHVKILDDKRTVFVRCLQDFEIGREALKPSYWRFETDGVLYNNTQREVYETVMTGVLNSVLEGNNAIILAFGQTGTGKSLTISGTENSYEDRGIIPRIIADLFVAKSNLQGGCKVRYQMSYVETTKMYIFDLLKDNNMFDMNSAKNVSAVIIDSEDQALKTVFQAEGRKSLVKNAPYNSHAASTVLTLIITKKLRTRKTVSKMHIVDLAGADTIGNLSCFYKDMFKVGSANLAKSQLEQFLLILIENFPEHILVKHRLSILIYYLRDSLNASSLLRFVGHIRTTKDDLRITMSMLRFGQIIRGLKIKKVQPVLQENEDFKLQALQEEVNILKRDRELNAMFANQDLSTNLTQERLQHVRNVTEEYLQDKVSDLICLSVADVQVVFKVFKSMYSALQAEKLEITQQLRKRSQDELSRKDSTLSSDIKNSKKSNIKSKESSIMNSQSSKTSKKSASKKSFSHMSSTSEKKKKSIKSLSVDSTETDKSLRHSKTSSKIIKTSSRSRRKMSTASTERILEEGQEAAMPEKVPGHEEAWKEFTENQDYQYKKLKVELEEYEAKTKEKNVTYLKEVKKLQLLRDSFDKASDDLVKTQMMTNLTLNEEYDEDGNIILTVEEIKLREVLKEGECNLVEQQEKILALQSELRVYLQLYQDVKRQINHAFESFCCNNYKTLVPNLGESFIAGNENVMPSILLPMEKIAEAQEDEEESKKISEQYNELMKYESLKKLMNKQKEKQLQKEILHRKWIRSCKN